MMKRKPHPPSQKDKSFLLGILAHEKPVLSVFVMIA